MEIVRGYIENSNLRAMRSWGGKYPRAFLTSMDIMMLGDLVTKTRDDEGEWVVLTERGTRAAAALEVSA